MAFRAFFRLGYFYIFVDEGGLEGKRRSEHDLKAYVEVVPQLRGGEGGVGRSIGQVCTAKRAKKSRFIEKSDSTVLKYQCFFHVIVELIFSVSFSPQPPQLHNTSDNERKKTKKEREGG